MKIKDLAKEQDKNTAIYQKEYLKIVKKLINKYGLESKELKSELKKQLKPLAISMVKSGYKLGEKWLK